MSELNPVNMGIFEKLSAANVEHIFKRCLLNDDEKNLEHIYEHGVKIEVYFKTSELKKYRQRITEMISQLPETFLQHKGGGWSFLNLCLNKDGQQWTDSHEVCDMLVCLGLAIDKIAFCLHRDMWSIFPGE